MIEPILVGMCGTTVIATATAVLMHRRALRAERAAGRLAAELDAQRHAASHDPLTGLLNRRAFCAEGRALLADPARPPLASMMVDIDHFKLINDRFGHAAGDHVLVTVARRLATFAGDDLVARLGGDEFAGLVRAWSADVRWLDLTARRLTAALAAPIPLGHGSVRVTASVGLAPVTGADLASALSEADAAMYRAKLTGTPPRHLVPIGVGA